MKICKICHKLKIKKKIGFNDYNKEIIFHTPFPSKLQVPSAEAKAWDEGAALYFGLIP